MNGSITASSSPPERAAPFYVNVALLASKNFALSWEWGAVASTMTIDNQTVCFSSTRMQPAYMHLYIVNSAPTTDRKSFTIHTS